MAPCPALHLHHHPATPSQTRLPRCPSDPRRSSSTTLSTSLRPWADIPGITAARPVPQTRHPAHRPLALPGGAALSAPARIASALSLFPPPLHLSPLATTPAHTSLNSHQRHTKGSCYRRQYKASRWWRTPTAATEPTFPSPPPKGKLQTCSFKLQHR